MSNTTAPTDTSDTTEAQATKQPTPNDVANNGNGQAPNADNTTDTLPDWARDKLTKANQEAARYRTELREHQAKVEELSKNTADLDEFKQKIGKALGLVDDTDDPQQLLEAATKREQEAQAERDQLATQLKEYRQRDAIRANAGGADVELLTALLKADKTFTDLDPSSDDYADQVKAFVEEKLTRHPSLRAQAAPPASGVDTSNTSSGADRKLTREDLKTMSAAEINQAVRDGKLNHLMKN